MLEIRSLSKRFLGVPALDHVSFSVKRGEIVGLIGPNGSGKTTLFDCITGFISPDAGSVILRGQDITGMPPYLICRLGLSRSFQQVRVFPRLTAMENLRAAGQQHQGVRLWSGIVPTRRSRRLEAELDARAQELLAAMGISNVADLLAGTLSYGQQKLLELCMALMSSPVMLLLDEPVAGVNPTLIQAIKGYLRGLNAGGTTLLIIEHNLEVVMDLCQRVIVLDSGELIAQGPPEEVQADERVLRAYFGR